MKSMQISPCRLMYSAILSLIAFSFCQFDTFAKPNETSAKQNIKAANESLEQKDRVADLEQKLTTLNNRLESELKASDFRFQLLGLIAAGGGILSAVFVIWSRYKDERRYREERGYYIKRIEEQDKRQEQEKNLYLERMAKEDERQQHERTLYLARLAEQDKRQEAAAATETALGNKLLDQYEIALSRMREQAQQEKSALERESIMGGKFLTQYDSMLSSQLESISKIGRVIELVGDTFDLQVKDQKNKSKLQQQTEEFGGLIDSLNQHYEEQFRSSTTLIGTFQQLDRMAWTRLTAQEERLTARARTIFNAIPPNILQKKEKVAPNDAARTYQLLGVSAFYANDIDESEKLLRKAYAIYSQGKGNIPKEYLYPFAFSCHFLGLIEKNWLHEARSIEENLGEAKRHLTEADTLIKKAGKKGEFLTPLTLAEVLSYTERERHLAQEKLEVLIKEFGSVQNLDGNQQALQQRAYLILGNLEFLDRRYDEARSRYDDVLNINEHNAYAILSKAQVAAINDPENKIGLYQQGLTALEKTGAINKHEITGRVLALAWAIIAAHEIGDHREEKYWNEFEKDSKDIRKVADREPMFFCPIAKTLVKFEELKKTLCFQTGRKEP